MVVRFRRSPWVSTALCGLSLWATPAGFGADPAGDTTGNKKPPAGASDFFESTVRPILADSCLKCHGEKKQASGLRLDSREAMLKGGANGPALIPGNPDASLVVQAVRYDHEDIKMPPSGRLADPAVTNLTKWVSEGAYWPDSGPKSAADIQETQKPHWAFQPIQHPNPPKVVDAGWVRTPVDSFTLSKLEASGIKPSPMASRRALIRRITFDLTGLPARAEDIQIFENDDRPDAYDRLVERLLASPEYGERWGRHWLDVARYADTKGYVFTEDRRYPFSYTYRDYVVNAFNRDLPFDQFIVQQLAADQLPLGNDPRPLAAMGFLTVGRRFLNDQNEIIDDRIDVVTRGFLGLTVTCARCHDHKFDPIPTADYYSLYGVFASSTEPGELPKLLPDEAREVAAEAEHARKVDAANARRQAFLAERHRESIEDFQGRFSRYFRAAWDLNFDPRHPELEKQATARKLDVNRLRALAHSLQRGLELVTPDQARESILQAWRTYSGLKPEGFKTNAVELAVGLKEKGTHPLLARALIASPPGSMADVVSLYTELLDGVEFRLRAAAAKGIATLDEPEWESLRQAIFGPNGLATLSPNSDRFLLKRAEKVKLEELDKEIAAVRASGPPPVPRGMVLNDQAKPVDPHIFVRGNPGRPGKPVPRQFLKVLAGPERKPFPKGSGRLDLARAIADPKNPLTARVLANRVWAWHFGAGLVSTASDFGMRSDSPSHPELLDWLANELIQSGWSLKRLHRLIVLSNTYRQSSELRPDCQERDPQNRFVWRFNRQRLNFEGLRDAILATAGSIDRSMGGKSVALSEQPFPTRRTLYGFIDRQNLDPVYRTFDFAVPDATTPRRFVTTVPQQALFLMNSPFLQEQARRLAAEIEREAGKETATLSDPSDRIKRLYFRVLGRQPGEGELKTAVNFFRQQSQAVPGVQNQPGFLLPSEQLAQVLLLTNEFSFID